MAAAVATIGALRAEGAIETMDRIGLALRAGIVEQAAGHGMEINYTGPPGHAVPDVCRRPGSRLASEFAAAAMRGGVYLHPRHNWFISAAMTDADVTRALTVTEQAFAAVAAVAHDNVAP